MIRERVRQHFIDLIAQHRGRLQKRPNKDAEPTASEPIASEHGAIPQSGSAASASSGDAALEAQVPQQMANAPADGDEPQGEDLALFKDDNASLSWLRNAAEHDSQCATLLQQIAKFNHANTQKTLRQELSAQKICLSHQERKNNDTIREKVRTHFIDLIAQHRGRLRTLAFPVQNQIQQAGPPPPSDTLLSVADLVDAPSLRTFRRQRPDMPSNLKEAISLLTGGVTYGPPVLKRITKALNVSAPDTKMGPRLRVDGKRDNSRRARLGQTLTVAMYRNECCRQVRGWASTVLVDAVLESTPARRPQTTAELS